MLGPDSGDKKEMVCLNRLWRWRDCWVPSGEATEHEADTRNVHMFQDQPVLCYGEQRLELNTPGVEVKVRARHQRKHGLLTCSSVSMSMRLVY